MAVTRVGLGIVLIIPLSAVGAGIAGAATAGLNWWLLARATGRAGAPERVLALAWPFLPPAAVTAATAWILLDRVPTPVALFAAALVYVPAALATGAINAEDRSLLLAARMRRRPPPRAPRGDGPREDLSRRAAVTASAHLRTTRRSPGRAARPSADGAKRPARARPPARRARRVPGASPPRSRRARPARHPAPRARDVLDRSRNTAFAPARHDARRAFEESDAQAVAQARLGRGVLEDAHGRHPELAGSSSTSGAMPGWLCTL